MGNLPFIPSPNWHPIQSFRNGEDGFILDFQDPSTLFQNTDFTNVVASDGDPVSSVRDLTNNNHDFVKDAGADPLLWQSDGPHPFVDVGDTPSNIRCVSNTSPFLWAASGCTIGIACNATPTDGGFQLLCESSTSSGTPIYAILRAKGAGGPITSDSAYIRDSSGELTADTMDATAAYDSTDNAIVKTDTGSSLTTYVDGVSADTEAYTRAGTLSPNRLCLGALHRSSISQPVPADVYALMAIDRVLGAAEIALWTTWLASKMGRVL